MNCPDLKETVYQISKLPLGGFVVTAVPSERGLWTPLLYASTTIEEALKFLKGKLA